MLKNKTKFNEFCKKRNAFSLKTFGSPEVRPCTEPLTHLLEEVQELIDNPDDELEWADCLLLLLDAAWRKGHTVDDLVKFAERKLKINKKRNWTKHPNGVFKHVK